MNMVWLQHITNGKQNVQKIYFLCCVHWTYHFFFGKVEIMALTITKEDLVALLIWNKLLIFTMGDGGYQKECASTN